MTKEVTSISLRISQKQFSTASVLKFYSFEGTFCHKWKHMTLYLLVVYMQIFILELQLQQKLSQFSRRPYFNYGIIAITAELKQW
jgi:hypothetical protein